MSLIYVIVGWSGVNYGYTRIQERCHNNLLIDNDLMLLEENIILLARW